ncbi:MAG TPA: SprT family zinc-dependent metalloprotease [Gammaproteobacteria bacterium]|nr:SprT family zinc-dependent metalloprotease [Gammaproteobacteria bacterium]
MKSEMPVSALPDYTVRVSPRAKHARLRISPEEGLVVVIPRGFDHRHIPEMLAARRAWLDKHLHRLHTHRQYVGDAPPPLPDTIALEAIGERWSVDYAGTQGARAGAFEGEGNRLAVKGAPGDPARCRAALRRWLSRKAHRHFEPWLHQVSRQTALPYERMIVRGQKTRWGSCSRHKTISLNYKLLFFPPHLVRYVFVHELCHTRVMNHSPRFWQTLGALDPHYRAHHEQMREAWRYVPAWVLAT